MRLGECGDETWAVNDDIIFRYMRGLGKALEILQLI